MKKCGFTLIETMISIFILMTLCGIGFSLSSLSGKIKSNIEHTGYLYEIQNLLSFSKSVCKEKNKYGKITVNSSKNQICFIEGWDKIERTVSLPKDMDIISNDMSILVTPDGTISRGTTIKIMNKNGERDDITIRVGMDLIVIKI